MTALAQALAAGGIGRAFFATVTLHARAPDAADALAVLEAALGRVTAIEARRTPRALLVQAQHEADAISQLLLHTGAPAIALELDGTTGSLRLRDGVLTLHRPGAARTIPLPAIAVKASPDAVARLTDLLRTAHERDA